MDIKELLAKANAPAATRQTESSHIHEENQFDELETFIDDVNISATPLVKSTVQTKDGQELEVGDPVVGLHRGQRMSGQVISIQDDMAVVEWKDREKTKTKIASLELTNVDDDYEVETMYVESQEPQPYMGFDKESFTEDTDLDSLLRGRADGSMGPSITYGNISDEL